MLPNNQLWRPLMVLLVIGMVHVQSLPAQTFVGSSACGACHAGHFASWSSSLHANLYQAPTAENMIAPWNGDVTITDPGRGLTITLELADDGAGGPPFTVRLFADPAKTMPLLGGAPLTLIRTHGGHAIAKNFNDGSLSRGGIAGEREYIGKQRFHVAINGAEYILPNQWNPVPDLDGNSGWVEYHARDWVDTGGNLIIEANGAKASEQRRCAGCHRTGINAVTFNGSRYVLNGNPTVEDNIGCEACHGPGGDHVLAPSPSNIVDPEDLTMIQQVDLCGSCHSRGHSVDTVNGVNLGYPYASRTFRPGDTWGDFFAIAAGFWPDGTSKQHHQQYHDFLKSDHFLHGGLTCTSCHDLHGTEEGVFGAAKPTFEHELRKPARGMANGTLCYDCHQATLFPNDNDADRTAHTNHLVSNIDPDCTNCHMPAVAKSAVHYDIHAHTFNVLPPELTLTSNMPNSCAIICHRGAGPEPNGGVVDTDINTWDSPSDITIANFLARKNGAHFWGLYK